MAITTNYIHNKFSLLTSTTFDTLIQKNEILKSHDVLLKVNLIGLLEIDNLEFTKSYQTHLQQCKSFFSDLKSLDDVTNKAAALATENNSQQIKDRISNLISFFEYYSFETGLEYIKQTINFLEINENVQEWKIYYSDIWQVSYCVALSKDLTLLQVEDLNILGLATIPSKGTLASIANNINIFQNLDSKFFEELSSKITDLKETYSSENITETIKFLNTLSNSELKTLWQLTFFAETYGFEEETLETFDKVLHPIITKLLEASEYINELYGFKSFLVDFTETVIPQESYYLFDDLRSDLMDAKFEISNDKDLDELVKEERNTFIINLSKFISVCFREKAYPINMIGEKEYFSAYDFVFYFQESLICLFDIFDYDLSLFSELIQSNDMVSLKKDINSKIKVWKKTLAKFENLDINKLFTNRYNKFKKIIDLQISPEKKGDHQNTIAIIFDLAEAIGKIPGVKRNYKLSVENIDKLIADFEIILNYIGEDSKKENIDSDIYMSISICFGLLGYIPATKSFDQRIIATYLNGYYNFDSIDSKTVVEDLRGFLI